MIDAHVHILNIFPKNIGLDSRKCASELMSFMGQFGVSRIIAVGYQLTDVAPLLELKSYGSEKISVGLGVHPWIAKEQEHLDDVSLKKILRGADFVGETGLDFFQARSTEERDIQESLLVKHLNAAELIGLPVILHWVKALHRQRFLFEHRTLRGIVHGWSGDRKEGEYWVDKGFLLGIGPRLLLRKTRQDLIWIPTSNLVIETDFPDIPALLLPLLDKISYRSFLGLDDWTEATQWVAALQWTTSTLAKYLGWTASRVEDVSTDNLTRVLARL